MYSYSPRPVQVRPEMDRMAEYIPGESQEAFSARTGISIEQLIKLNSNESPYGPAREVMQALGNHRSYNNYPDTESSALRQALAKYVGVPGHHIVLSHGSNELINLLWHIFLSVGDNIICHLPTFSLYTTMTSFCGASVVEVSRTSRFDVDIKSTLAALTSATMLIVICSPTNPTGNSIAKQDILASFDT